MPEFEDTDIFRRVLRQIDDQLPDQQLPVGPPEPQAWPMPAGPSARQQHSQAEYRDPVHDTNPRGYSAVPAVLPNYLPEHVPASPTPPEEGWSNGKKGAVAVVAAAVVFGMLGLVAKHTGADERTTAATHHAGHNHNGKVNKHKGDHVDKSNQANTTTITSSASPAPHPKQKLKGYLLTQPTPTAAPSTPEAPTPTATPTHNPVHVGAASIKFATFNVHGAIHTPARGPKSGVNRAKKQAELIMQRNIAIVGHQEFEWPQRKTEMNVLPANYKVFPKQAQYGVKTNKINSVNSIVYDSDQVKLIKAKSMPMIYFHGWHYKIPLVQFETTDTHQKFWVANTHDPAHPQYAKFRWMDALRHAEDARDIISKHKSLVFLGDFNSGYHKRTRGNTTYMGQPKNLTVNIMENQGNMVDVLHDLRGKQGRKLRRQHAAGPGIVDHGFISKDLKVTDANIIEHGTQSDHSVVTFTVKFPQNKHHHGSKR